MGRCLEQWAPPVFLKLTPEQVQDPDKLVKYLQKCVATLGTPERHRSPQCAGVWPTPTELPCSTLFSALKGKGGEKKRQALRLALPPQPALQPLPTGTTAAGAAPVALVVTAAAPAPAPAAGIAAEPNDQPVLVAVAPVKLKKDAKRADCSGRDDDEPGSSRETETEIITRSLSLSELRDMRKDFTRHPGEHIVTWLLRCWDNGASSLELEGQAAGIPGQGWGHW